VSQGVQASLFWGWDTMSGNEFPKHAVRIRWRSFSAEVFGWPAIVLLGLVVLLLGVGHLPTLLAYLPHFPWQSN
jgi:hypothetical protein